MADTLVATVDGPLGKAEIYEITSTLESGALAVSYEVRSGGTLQTYSGPGRGLYRGGRADGVEDVTRPPHHSPTDAASSFPLPVGITLFGLVTFTLLSVAVERQWLLPVDMAAAAGAQLLDGQLLDLLASLAAVCFSFEAVCAGAAIGGLVLWRRRFGAWSLVPFGFVPLTVVEAVLKLTLRQPPIPPELQRSYAYPLLHAEFPGSYPSGHAMRTAFVCVLTACLLMRRRPTVARGVIALVVSFLVIVLGLTRVYLEVHWLTDVIAGLLLGTTAALVLAPALLTRLDVVR